MSGLARHGALALLGLLILPLTAYAGSGLAALQAAAPSCADDSGDTFVDCGNGTVTDTRSGLVWLQDTGCFGLMTWSLAMQTVANLSDLPGSADATCPGGAGACDCGLSDGSAPGEWRLPSIDELDQLIEGVLGAGCVSTLSGGDALHCDNPPCDVTACGFTGVASAPRWSATTNPLNHVVAFAVDPATVGQLLFPKTTTQGFVWPVRGGQ